MKHLNVNDNEKVINLVVLNEQHTLLDEQKALLTSVYGNEWEIFIVPATGWTRKEMEEIGDKFSDLLWDRSLKVNIIFASPVPYLLASAAYSDGRSNADVGIRVFVFHNDKREKKELPNGKIIFTVAQEGWEIV